MSCPTWDRLMWLRNDCVCIDTVKTKVFKPLHLCSITLVTQELNSQLTMRSIQVSPQIFAGWVSSPKKALVWCLVSVVGCRSASNCAVSLISQHSSGTHRLTKCFFVHVSRLHRPASCGKCQPHRVRSQLAPVQPPFPNLPDLWPEDGAQEHCPDDLLEQIRREDSVCKGHFYFEWLNAYVEESSPVIIGLCRSQSVGES